VRLVSGEVQNGAADDDVGRVIRKAARLHCFLSEVRERKKWGEPMGEDPDGADRLRIGIDRGDPVALTQEEDEVTSMAAACVEHAHSRDDSATEKLIEEVDVDLSEE
jgi:hypothetical protein